MPSESNRRIFSLRTGTRWAWPWRRCIPTSIPTIQHAEHAFQQVTLVYQAVPGMKTPACGHTPLPVTSVLAARAPKTPKVCATTMSTKEYQCHDNPGWDRPDLPVKGLVQLRLSGRPARGPNDAVEIPGLKSQRLISSHIGLHVTKRCLRLMPNLIQKSLNDRLLDRNFNAVLISESREGSVVRHCVNFSRVGLFK